MSLKAISHWPGHISMVNTPNVDYPGVKAKWFWSVSQYDKFFQEKEGQPAKAYIVTGVTPVPYFFGLFVGVLCHFTKQLSPEEEADNLIVTREVEFKMAELRQKRSEAMQEQRQVEHAAKEEQARLAYVGKKYEDRVAHMRSMAASNPQRKEMEKVLAGGDPDVLFLSKADAWATGYVQGHKAGKEGDK